MRPPVIGWVPFDSHTSGRGTHAFKRNRNQVFLLWIDLTKQNDSGTSYFFSDVSRNCASIAQELHDIMIVKVGKSTQKKLMSFV